MAEPNAVRKMIATVRPPPAGIATMPARRCAAHCGHERSSSEHRGHWSTGPNVVAALIFCWAALGMPTGKRLAFLAGT